MKLRHSLLFPAALLVAPLHGENTDSYTAGQGDNSKVAANKPDHWMAHTRFGMFIHFGLYSIPAGVWKGEEMGRNHYAEWLRAQWGWPHSIKGVPKEQYDTLLKSFNPNRFDAEEWIDLAAKAGMKYFVITAKHHDGFALWDSKVSGYDIAATPFGANGRDPLGELVAACRKHGVKVGFYYSHWQDWEHAGGARPPWPEIKPDPAQPQPSDADFGKYWEEKCLPQVSELLQRYQPDMLWFDSWGENTKSQVTPARRDQLIALIRKEGPQCMINGRIAAYDPSGADFVSMGDNEFPDEKNAPKVPWETPATMNHSWGYHRLDFQWRSFDNLLDSLVTNASYGGSITLNVGPMGNGKFQQAAVRRLKEFAAWNEINGSALDHTARSPFKKGELPDDVRATLGTEENKPWFNLILLKPKSGTITIPQPLVFAEDKMQGFRAQVLETREFLPVKREAGRLTITLSKELAGIDHPVIRVGPESSIPYLYEDGTEVTPVKPGDFRR